MPPFIENAMQWATFSGRHFVVMLWWVWVVAVIATAVSEAFVYDRWHRRLLQQRDHGWQTVWHALVLGMLNPPGRRRVFRQAKELLADGVSPAGVMAYLLAAQTVFIWMLLFIVELDGPQPALGQLVAVIAALAVLTYGIRSTPNSLWESARESAAKDLTEFPESTFIPRFGPWWARVARSVGGQAYSLAWPLLFGLVGIGFFLALGQSSAYLSLQGSKGPLVQLGNSAVGLLLAYVTGAPPMGNALVAAGLWKAEFVTYAGLSAFYLGTLVTPFAIPRYVALLGSRLSQRMLLWLVGAIIVGALVATAWWWGLDWLAGGIGVRDLFESLSHSTLRPNNVPWFHHWFQPMSGM